MDIYEIAEYINELSSGYEIGKLQSIRKEIKGLSRKPGSKIFNDASISEKGWAFHYGGRTELQFNIGFEEEGFRYGIAFSLETSQSLPDVSILYPKIAKLNDIIREHPEYFNNYSMWYWQEKRSKISHVFTISDEIMTPNTFIFIGKIDDGDELNYHNILSTFDDLLKIYIVVESN